MSVSLLTVMDGIKAKRRRLAVNGLQTLGKQWDGSGREKNFSSAVWNIDILFGLFAGLG
ncbi:MAG: hypothetical protein LWW81_12700 [Rhodocyclales bacterium]|nr:hypothetical protein [Rhodocyclales bacterium]